MGQLANNTRFESSSSSPSPLAAFGDVLWGRLVSPVGPEAGGAAAPD